VLVIAIFHFIFAACGGIGNLAQLAGGSAGLSKMFTAGDPKQAKVQDDIQAAIQNSFPAYPTYEKAEAAFGLLLAALLLVAGIGLLSMQPWARVLSLLWAGLQIINVVVGLIIAVAYIMPATNAAMKSIPGVTADQAQVISAATSVGIFVGGCVGLIYPIAVLIVMLLPGVAAAFRAPDVDYDRGRREEGEEDDFGYERRRDEGGWGDQT
jgi:hypothetical protein